MSKFRKGPKAARPVLCLVFTLRISVPITGVAVKSHHKKMKLMLDHAHTLLSTESRAWRVYFRIVTSLNQAERENDVESFEEALDDLRGTAYATSHDKIHLQATRVLSKYPPAPAPSVWLTNEDGEVVWSA